MAKLILPNEVNDRILDHLHDDHATLRLCGLVCTKWIPTVRFHCFFSVRLRWSAIAHFCEILQASPLIAPYVSQLVINNNGFVTPHRCAMCEVLSRLTNLRVLRLAHLIILPDDVQPLFTSLPKSLECITVNQMDIPSVGDLIYLWTQLPHLRSFISVEVLWIRSREISASHRCAPMQVSLQELHLRWQIRYLDVLVDWLHAQNVTTQLRACSLYFVNADSGPAMAKLLRAMGPDLKTLELFVLDMDQFDGLHVCNLAQCTGLTELRLWTSLERTLGWADVKPESIVWMGRFLSQVSAPSIGTVELAFDGADWHEDRLLVNLQQATTPLLRRDIFRDLEQVIIRLRYRNTYSVDESVLRNIRRDLAHFDARDMLKIEVVREKGKRW